MVAPKSAIVSYFDLNLRAAPLGGSDAAACSPSVLSEVHVAPAIPTGDSDIEACADKVKPIGVSSPLRTPVSPTVKEDIAKERLTTAEGVPTFDSTKVPPLKPISEWGLPLTFDKLVINGR